MYYNTEVQIIATICNKLASINSRKSCYFNSVNRIHRYLHLVQIAAAIFIFVIKFSTILHSIMFLFIQYPF